MARFTKDPDADLDYGWDWSDFLGADTIVTSTWAITKAPASTTDPVVTEPTIVLSASTHGATTTTVWVDGGTNGKDYAITNHIVTTAGREDDRTHQISIRPR